MEMDSRKTSGEDSTVSRSYLRDSVFSDAKVRGKVIMDIAVLLRSIYCRLQLRKMSLVPQDSPDVFGLQTYPSLYPNHTI